MTQRILPDGTVGDDGICRGCQAEIVWIMTKNGKSAPMNPDGTSHFGTCPAHDRFRKKKPVRE